MTALRTRLLGATYPGRPMFGSLASRLVIIEREEGPAAAQALLDAHNRIAAAFGKPPVDLASQFTDLPMEGLVTCPARTDFDRVVTKTARRAA